MNHVSALSDFFFCFFSDLKTLSQLQGVNSEQMKWTIFKNYKYLRVPDNIVVVVFKKLSQNSPKEHNKNSESEQPVT